MKLVNTYNRVNIVISILVLITVSTCFYFIVRFALIRQLDNTLKVEEAEIKDFIRQHKQLPASTHYKDQQTDYEISQEPVQRRFRNIHIYDSAENELEIYRQLMFPVMVEGHYYKASVIKSESATEKLFGLILIITVAVIILLVGLLYIANRLLLKKIWKPFSDTLYSIKGFSLSSTTELPLRPGPIDEFTELNEVLHNMTRRIVKDYQTLKTFTDNASHEMQTPLAVINSKLDLLIQDPALDSRQVSQLQAMYDAVGKLTKLNQSLLLLTKIENNQFAFEESIQLDTLIREKLSQLEDIIHNKVIHIETNLELVWVNMNGQLADILLNNLLSNAIRHNTENGFIRILLTQDSLQISNPGKEFSFESSGVFNRFIKGDQSAGLGLGLAIVKEIADKYHFPLNYRYAESLHLFQVDFRISG